MGERHSAADIADQFVAATSHFGFTKFSFLSRGRRRDGGSFQHIATNYPAGWRQRVLAQKYLDIDPTLHRARRTALPFVWSELRDARNLQAPQRQLFDEAAAFGLRHGLTVPVHAGSGGSGMVALSGDMSQRDFTAAIETHRHDLHLLGLHFHALSVAAYDREEIDKQLTAGSDTPEISIRECECLLWTARGKSAWETALVLGISERTVNFHVENARRKLNAQTKTQAVVQAIMQNLIRP
jgi:DNA-binding CsgD family transcriptional regulator